MAVSPEVYAAWDEPTQIAFLINAYNILPLQSIIDQTPLKGSIRDIVGVWNFRKHIVMGQPLTPDEIEHDILIDQAVAREGFKIVLLTRLSPVFPFNLLNYAFGITGVGLKDYALGSIGMIPGTVMYVYIGSLAGELARIGTESQAANPFAQWAIRIIGFVATVAVTVYVTRVAQQALAQKVS
ncbi:MAG: VTT domain-containing protein [Nodosilinea sp.]